MIERPMAQKRKQTRQALFNAFVHKIMYFEDSVKDVFDEIKLLLVSNLSLQLLILRKQVKCQKITAKCSSFDTRSFFIKTF